MGYFPGSGQGRQLPRLPPWASPWSAGTGTIPWITSTPQAPSPASTASRWSSTARTAGPGAWIRQDWAGYGHQGRQLANFTAKMVSSTATTTPCTDCSVEGHHPGVSRLLPGPQEGCGTPMSQYEIRLLRQLPRHRQDGFIVRKGINPPIVVCGQPVLHLFRSPPRPIPAQAAPGISHSMLISDVLQPLVKDTRARHRQSQRLNSTSGRVWLRTTSPWAPGACFRAAPWLSPTPSPGAVRRRSKSSTSRGTRRHGTPRPGSGAPCSDLNAIDVAAFPAPEGLSRGCQVLYAPVCDDGGVWSLPHPRVDTQEVLRSELPGPAQCHRGDRGGGAGFLCGAAAGDRARGQGCSRNGCWRMAGPSGPWTWIRRPARCMQDRFGALPHFHLLQGDAVQVPLPEGPPWSVVGNLPYNAATAILTRFLLEPIPWERMVLMFQLEVGQKLLGKPGEKAYGPLSVLAQLTTRMTRLMKLGPGAFRPAPKVDSVVLLFEPRPDAPAMPCGGRCWPCSTAASPTAARPWPTTGKPWLEAGDIAAILAAEGLPPAIRAEAIPPPLACHPPTHS